MDPRRWLHLFVVLLLAALLSGCGGDASGETEGGGAEAEELTAKTIGPRVLAALRKAESFHLEVGMGNGSAGSTVTSEGYFEGGQTNYHSRAVSGDREVEAIVLGDDLFTKAAIPQATKPWMHLALSQTTGDGERLRSSNGYADVGQYAKVLSESTALAPPADGGEIDGVLTRKYVVTVPSSALVFIGFSEEVTGGLPESIDLEAWIDDDDLLRKFSFDPDALDYQSATEFSGFGDEVTLKAPPADQVDDQELTMDDLP